VTSRCATCQALRPPNETFCPQCGTAFDMARGRLPSPPPKLEPVDFTVWAGVKLGAGLVIGVGLVAAIVFVLVAVAVTTAFR
jgi:hypothetical protein